jgi:hypothetical protein
MPLFGWLNEKQWPVENKSMPGNSNSVWREMKKRWVF